MLDAADVVTAVGAPAVAPVWPMPKVTQPLRADIVVRAPIQTTVAVSYTHLDVYKRQTAVWRTVMPARSIACNMPRLLITVATMVSWACLLYTSRCV